VYNPTYYDPYPYGPYSRQGFMPVMAAAPMQTENIFEYPQNLQGALMLIQQAVAGENEDRLFYSWLIDHAPSYEDKQIIAGIRDNEISHFGYFRQIYSEITGEMPPQIQGEAFTVPGSYCEGLGRALMGEQNAVQKYRKILYAMQTRVHINMLTEIITDELRHGLLYSYLYAKNACGG
jgi:rubrerythrin